MTTLQPTEISQHENTVTSIENQVPRLNVHTQEDMEIALEMYCYIVTGTLPVTGYPHPLR